jgi:signal peptidase I
MSQGSPTDQDGAVGATQEESTSTMTDIPTLDRPPSSDVPSNGVGASSSASLAGRGPDSQTVAVAAGPGGDGDNQMPADGSTQPDKSNSSRHQLASWLVVLVLATVCAIGLRAFVVQTFYVPSSSMYPTLQIGDRILVQKIGYSIERGDILVFRRPPGDVYDTNNEDLVKRVIGLPGETISSKGNTVYINGKPLAEPYLPKGTILGREISPPVKIPAGDYYMLGDNRNDSEDSRYWGFLPQSYVVGKVFVIVWRHGHPWFHPL